jgi:hypothetical protein
VWPLDSKIVAANGCDGHRIVSRTISLGPRALIYVGRVMDCYPMRTLHPAEMCEFDMSITGVLRQVDRLSPNFQLT